MDTMGWYWQAVAWGALGGFALALLILTGERVYRALFGFCEPVHEPSEDTYEAVGHLRDYAVMLEAVGSMGDVVADDAADRVNALAERLTHAFMLIDEDGEGGHPLYTVCPTCGWRPVYGPCNEVLWSEVPYADGHRIPVAVCILPCGTEHDHSTCTAGEAVRRGRARALRDTDVLYVKEVDRHV